MKPFEVKTLTGAKPSITCDGKCGNNAKFSFHLRDMFVMFLCPICFLNMQTEIQKHFNEWFKKSH